MAQFEQGYDERQFTIKVDENFHCPLCLNVLREPVQCRRNEHYFCTPCVLRHFERNSQTCPVCNEPLTPKSLKEPSRIVVNYLSTLKIVCSNAKQGCPAILPLPELKDHTFKCEFTPVPCSIEGCNLFVLRRDKSRHETQFCKFRKVKCGVCSEVVFQQKYDTHGCVLKRTIVELKGELAEAKDEVSTLKDIARISNERQQKQEKKIGELEAIMVELKQQLRDMGTRGEDKTTDMKKDDTDAAWDIMVVGGHDGTNCLKSVEVFNCARKSWSNLAGMREARLAPSAFLYQSNVVVTGGFDGSSSIDTMERMVTKQGSVKQWLEFKAKLPFKCNRHVSVLSENRLFVIGGEDGDRNQISDAVYEIVLGTPLTCRLAARMPEPRVGHNAVLYKAGKVLIFGGKTSRSSKDALRSVLILDTKKSQLKPVEALPYDVSQMVSCCHGDSIIIAGGQDKDGNVLRKVFAYNIKTGKSKMLADMGGKREGATAALKGGGMIVMGGRDEGKKYLTSVERFDLERQVWESLPPMSTPRVHAASLVNTT